MRVFLASADLGSIGQAISYLSQFFTILTNLLVMLAMVWVASGRALSFTLVTALTAAIVTVGVVYHLVLAQLWEPTGLVWLADHFVHTIVPALMFFWWLGFADKRSARWSDAAVCVVWLLAYCAYALVRGEFSRFYPYPFLDVATLGFGRVMLNSIGLALAIFVFGVVLTAYARRTIR
jgi:hypothetical protein